jgi:hypothetical protein
MSRTEFRVLVQILMLAMSGMPSASVRASERCAWACYYPTVISQSGCLRPTQAANLPRNRAHRFVPNVGLPALHMQQDNKSDERRSRSPAPFLRSRPVRPIQSTVVPDPINHPEEQAGDTTRPKPGVPAVSISDSESTGAIVQPAQYLPVPSNLPEYKDLDALMTLLEGIIETSKKPQNEAMKLHVGVRICREGYGPFSLCARDCVIL